MSGAASIITESQKFCVSLTVSQPHEADQEPTLCDEAPVNKQHSAMTFVGCSQSLNEECCDDQQCPPYGVMSVLGRRREMEDAVAVCPALVSLPCYAVGGCKCDCPHAPGIKCSLHFFGVYDGHGGSQAALFCKDRLHVALVEELKAVSYFDSFPPESINDWELQWEKIMLSCFRKVDSEVGGGVCIGEDCDRCAGNGSCAEPIAPETVGSTAIVAVVSSFQIIVANCGDSRAVLSRGGEVIALSADHKPDREDEMARVEAAGGRVIFWDGYRILGVLAMSRAIGDRYLKPSVIADPEVKCVQRAEDDEFLILATDGLWDVLSNEAACDVARKCIAGRCNHNSIDGLPPTRRGRGSDDSPASAAATLLTKLALARGSKDNISVVVVDLKGKQKQQLAP